MRRGILVACAALASLAQACGGGGETSGAGGTSASAGSMPTTSSQSGGGGPCGSLVWDRTNAACNQCVVDKCCAELAACDQGTKCGALLACAGACAPGDATCVKGCGTHNHSDAFDARPRPRR